MGWGSSKRWVRAGMQALDRRVQGPNFEDLQRPSNDAACFTLGQMIHGEIIISHQGE